MRAVRSKAIAKLVYGDMARRPGSDMGRGAKIRFLRKFAATRKVYQRAKRSWKDRACMKLIMELN